MTTDLHNDIMNLPSVNVAKYEQEAVRLAYKEGHRDARHQAAERVAAYEDNRSFESSVDKSECAALLAHVYENANSLGADVLERIGKMSVALQQPNAAREKGLNSGISQVVNDQKSEQAQVKKSSLHNKIERDSFEP